jgi:hypothetical protein
MPQVKLTRIHGEFAQNSKLWVLVTPAKQGNGKKLNDDYPYLH